MKFSVAVITLNEEKNLARCLASVEGLTDDIVVVDSGSSDRTVEIAKAHGARVLNRAWTGFYDQKTFATASAAHDWVLSLDADEELSSEARAFLGEWSKTPSCDTVDGYEFHRRNFYLGRWMKHGANYPDRQVRLFHRGHAHWLNTNVHERVIAQRIEKTRIDILHYPRTSIKEMVDTINRYSALRAQDFKAKGKRFSSLKMVAKIFSKFFEIYFFKRGFLDGAPGLILALNSSFATFLRWAKLYELENPGLALPPESSASKRDSTASF